MRPAVVVRATLLSATLILSLAGCGSDEKEMSQKEIQYLSHLDQARFYQRQGELKASTREARGAIEMLPGKIDPYFLIIENLLTAGDAVNVEQQAKQLLQQISDKDVSPTVKNRANLILSESYLKQAKFSEALAALQGITLIDNPTQLKTTLLEAQIHLAADQHQKARQAYELALELDPTSIQALIGLSKTAMSSGDSKTAQTFLAQAEEVDQNHPDLWLWKAQIAHMNENWQTAEEAYIQALEDIGQYDVMTAQKYTTTTALIQALRAQGKYSEAYVYEEILAKSPPGRAKNNLIAANQELKAGNLKEAEHHLKEVLAQAPDHQQSRLMLGLVKFKQGHPEEAKTLLAPIVQSGGSTIATKMLAAAMIQLGNPEAAQSALSELESIDTDPEILTLVAIASLETGDWENGEALMEKALALKRENHDLRLRYASYLSQRGAYEKALSEVSTVRRHAPKLDSARSLEIQIHLKAGDTLSAEASADNWIKDQPESVAALLLRGNVAMKRAKADEAKTFFTKAQEAAPQSIAPLIALGRLAMTQSDHEQAQRHFRKAAQISPEAPLALQGVMATHNKNEARAFLQSIASDHPEAIGPKLVLLETALLDGNKEEADKYTAALLERQEQSTPTPATPMAEGIYSNAIVNLSKQGKRDQANTILDSARALFPDSESIMLLAAKARFNEGKTNEAKDLLAEARKQHPYSARPIAMEAGFLEQQSDFRQAAELFAQALKKQPNAELASSYALNLQRSGQSEKALSYLESEIKAYPRDSKLRLTLAMMQQSMADDEAATANYEQILVAEPDNVVALNNLAWLYHKQHDDRAIGLAEQAYKLSPGNASVADTYGWILLQSGNFDKSVPILEKAYEIQPDSLDIARHLAEAYKTAGMKAAADRLLKKLDEQG